MDITLVSLVALVASGLTLFSGFGLGTLLMPIVALFFPVELAIAMTAMVHFANNLFKVALVGRHTNRQVLLRFGLPAIAAAFLGAWLLGTLATTAPITEVWLWGAKRQIKLLELIVGGLILVFVVLELTPWWSKKSFDRRYLPLGGAISGFFGGLSGHQGAFRSMFLIKAGLSKEQFIGTGVMLAVLVDLARLLVYGTTTLIVTQGIDWALVSAATLSAFAGAYAGTRLVKKVTLRSVQFIVSAFLALIAMAMMAGIL
ncbi:MAG: sulfite exporter TauE/SafE family protein [Myxococcales bacterium]|nr:sulfite exporter TauE/SafE family protein [Myxococcales bacterium]